MSEIYNMSEKTRYCGRHVRKNRDDNGLSEVVHESLVHRFWMVRVYSIYNLYRGRMVQRHL